MINVVEKIVFSRTLARVKETLDWKNVRLIREAQPEEIKRLKQLSGKDIAIFGSNDLATHLLRMGFIDELRIMVNPCRHRQRQPAVQRNDRPREAETFESEDLSLRQYPSLLSPRNDLKMIANTVCQEDPSETVACLGTSVTRAS